MGGVFTSTSQVATHSLLAQAHRNDEFRQKHLPKKIWRSHSNLVHIHEV